MNYSSLFDWHGLRISRMIIVCLYIGCYFIWYMGLLPSSLHWSRSYQFLWFEANCLWDLFWQPSTCTRTPDGDVEEVPANGGLQKLSNCSWWLWCTVCMIRTRFVTYSLDGLRMKTNTAKNMQKVLGIRTSFKYFQIMHYVLKPVVSAFLLLTASRYSEAVESSW